MDRKPSRFDHLSDDQLSSRLLNEGRGLDHQELARAAVNRIADLRVAGRQSSPELSSLAAEVLRDPKATDREKRLAGSVLSQDETKGQS